ncbi:hypothetical protein K1T71_006985 [Dendrolimus kikuchii]|uniref:Uncharacterized protein n=1 Tax=Dendrolimus kikuchii TaxID=765133 RepID=A0ACC1CZG6_9NEOP|nr:hypothetical protein K1T71_006985 [Dendrolimus kikuchii]
MEGINENNYYIIEFVTPCNGEKYAILPHSWIKSGKPTKGVVVVAYPKEHPIITTRRAKHNEECGENWKTYVATIKHDCSDFDAAKFKLNWITFLNKSDQTLTELTPTMDHNASKINPINLQNDNQNNNRNGLLQKPTSTQSTTINISSDVQNHPVSTKNQNHYVESSKSEQLLPTYTDYLFEGLNLQECAPNLLTNTNRIDQNISQNFPSAVQNPSKAINNSVKYNSPHVQNRSDLDTHNEKTVNGRSAEKNCIMQSNSCKITTENRSPRIDVSQSLTVPSKPNETFIPHPHPGNNTSSLKMPATSTTPIDTTEKEKRRQENNGKHVKKSYNNTDDGLRNDDSKDRCNLNNKQNSNRSLDFPPEYDSNDTRWTLKHRKFVVGIVELVPRSSVYISVTEYARCIRKANNCTSLAQMLLTSIFSDRALRVCSLFGENTGTKLDEHTKEVILKFVAVYGIENDWPTYSSHTMTDILNNKIQDIRSKLPEKKRLGLSSRK